MPDFLNPAVRADVPLSIHPDVLLLHSEVLDVDGAIGRDALPPARWAYAALYDFYAKAEDAERESHKVAKPGRIAPGRTEGDWRAVPGGLRHFHGREAEVADAISAAYERIMPQVENQIAAVRRTREELAKKVVDAIDYSRGHSGEGLAVSQEVRNHVRALPNEDRLPFLNRALEADDRQTIGAVLSAPAYLSGLDGKLYEVVRGMAANRWAKSEAAQVEALDRVVADLSKAAVACQSRMIEAQRLKQTPKARADAALKALTGT